MKSRRYRKSVVRFNNRNRLVSKWAHPKPFCATPFGEKVALEVFTDPLADFLAGKLQDKPHKAPAFLRHRIVDFDDYRTLALIVVAPLLDCMTWDRDDPSAAAKLKLKVGTVIEARLPYMRPWTERERLRAGGWLISQALALDLFDLSDGFPKISDKWLPELDRLREEMIRAHPVHEPIFDRPPDWTSWFMEVPERVRAPFVRRDWWPEHRAAITEALKDPNWEHARAVNTLQRVPFRIDAKMLELVERYGADVMGHEYQKRWDDERTIADDIMTAKYIGDRTFYIPRNCDKRGRIYSVCHFNFDRGDHIRSLFRFARGMNLDREEQTFWLEVHCANCGPGEVDKCSWSKRLDWVAKNLDDIKRIAAHPEDNFDLWKGAESPFCYVAACRELVGALNDPENFVTHLPIGFDGSCNGLQHLALIARDPKTGYMVNVCPDANGNWPNEPQDVYVKVIAGTKRLLQADDEPWARWWLSRFPELGEKKTRKLIKTPSMTFAYSATQGGMCDQIKAEYKGSDQDAYDATRPEGKRDGCSYLAGKIIEACREVLKEPTKVMEYIQDIARRRMDRGLFLEWMSPSGFYNLNRYHKPKEPETINLKTYGIRVRHNISEGFEDATWRDKAIAAATANFVHSLDAAHLVKVVNSAGYIRDIITIHDCYYCLAPVATKFNRIIRDEMGGMYPERDALVNLHNRNIGHDHSCSHACCAALPRAFVPALIPPRHRDALKPELINFSEDAFG